MASYWTTVDGVREDRPLDIGADGVAWVAPSPVEPWRLATAAEVERAEPMAYGHWGPRVSQVAR